MQNISFQINITEKKEHSTTSNEENLGIPN